MATETRIAALTFGCATLKRNHPSQVVGSSNTISIDVGEVDANDDIASMYDSRSTSFPFISKFRNAVCKSRINASLTVPASVSFRIDGSMSMAQMAMSIRSAELPKYKSGSLVSSSKFRPTPTFRNNGCTNVS